MRKRWIAAAVMGCAVLLGAQGAGIAAPASAWAVDADLAPPIADIESGRYVGAQTVVLTAQEGAEIRYTLDGTRPTRHSPLVTGPVTIDRSANLTAVAFTEREESRPLVRGILVKTEEQPLSQFAVMSDIHLSSDGQALVTKWQSYFDALKRIVPNPDAIVSNGDQINDNNFNTAHHHQYPRAMLEQNLARTGMTDTDVYMTFGNHDDRVERMAAQYPQEWFPSTAGYYETAIGGFPALMVNTEKWDATQASWLYGRLTALTDDPATQGQPIFVFGHRPLPGTVWDGAQTSNPGLRGNLADFPQVVYFSGHSHLNISDERSIHQESFTAINEGSMSYEEIDSIYQPFGIGLAKEYTVPTAQSVVVEVYADRVEVDRINYAADAGRTYDDAGAWGFQQEPPFDSTGTLAGPSWVIARGATPAETKAAFTYTQANRNASGPVWGEAQPTVRQTENGPVLRLPQAADDQFVNDYSLELLDLNTQQRSGLLPVGARVYADYILAPRPAVLDIPLAVRQNDRVGQPVDRTLVIGHEYEATLVAYDSYRNASAPRTFRFVAGAIDRRELDSAIERSGIAIGTVERVLGLVTPATPEDYALAIADPAAAEAAAAALRARIGLDPAAQGATASVAQLGVNPTTQDAADAEARAIGDSAAELEAMLVAVDRAPLKGAIDRARVMLADKRADREAAVTARFERAIAAAEDVAGSLNRTQQQLDDAATALDAALVVFRDAAGTGGNGGPGAGGPGAGGSGTGGSGALAETGAPWGGAWIALAVGLVAAGVFAGGSALRARRNRDASGSGLEA